MIYRFKQKIKYYFCHAHAMPLNALTLVVQCSFSYFVAIDLHCTESPTLNPQLPRKIMYCKVLFSK